MLDPDPLEGARHVDELLASFSGRDNAEFWTHEALASAVQWAEVRSAAAEVLKGLAG